MSAYVPATIEKDITDGVNALLDDAPRYIDPETNLRYSGLLRDVKKLTNVSGAVLHLCSAYVKHASGDIDGVRHHLKNAASNAADPLYLLDIEFNCLCNLGFFSEAKRAHIKLSAPLHGKFTSLHDRAGMVGAFRAMREHTIEANKMQLDLSAIKYVGTFDRASNVLDKTGTTESEVDALLDIAGQVMREHRLFFLGMDPEITVIDDEALDCCVFVNYTLGVSHAEAADLMLEVAGRAADNLPRFPPGFSVGFKGVNA